MEEAVRLLCYPLLRKGAWSMNETILVVDDDREIVKAIAILL